MNKFQNLNYDKMGKERIKREHDLLKLNCVSDSEFESRMAVWDRMAISSAPLGEAKNFIETTFNKLQNDVVNASRDFQVSFTEFEVMAKDEINYIRLNVADQKTQLVWFAIITLMIAGTVAICM
ncbi:thiamine-phosphate diphosphorylase [Vibrio thalassae]|uniref:thiamine-phosphate diphosphorylase n=1 Tax=Vibrio thalassae TaxID=1243014 RepID=UPI001FC9FCF8|nr:thiamine-phosphate diphosphorylase [Vibrio thalassae]